MRRRYTDATQLEQFVAENVSDLLAYAERRVGNPADAADALGDALEIIWKKQKQVPRDSTQARMYMFVVLRNVMLNTYRTKRRRSAALDQLRTELHTQAIQAHESEQAERSLDVARAIAQLPEAQAEIVRLVHWDGFTLVGAAELMGIPASTARGRYATARETLKNLLSRALL